MRGYRLIKEHNEKRRECPHCNTVKPFIFKMWSGRSRVYMDDKGRNWAGSWCPDCHAAKFGKHYQKRRRLIERARRHYQSDDIDSGVL